MTILIENRITLAQVCRSWRYRSCKEIKMEFKSDNPVGATFHDQKMVREPVRNL